MPSRSAITDTPAARNAAGGTSVEVIPACRPGSGRQPHVLVCLMGEALDVELIRQGRVLAERLSARLTLLHAFPLGEREERRRAVARVRETACGLQAPLIELPAYSAVAGIVEFARSRDVTHVVLGDSDGVPWYAAWRETLSQQLARQLDGVDLYLVMRPAAR